MSSLGHLLLFHVQLLEQLLTGPHTGNHYVDVLVRPETRQRYGFFGQIRYLDRFTHVQDEDFASATHRAGLQNELGRFRNGHKVTGHFRMGYGYRPSGEYLLSEYRY